MRFVSCGIKSKWTISKTKMLSYQLKANLDEKIFYGKITHLTVRIMPQMWFVWESRIACSILVNGLFDNDNSTPLSISEIEF